MTLTDIRHSKRRLTHAVAAGAIVLLSLSPGCGMRGEEPSFPNAEETEVAAPRYVTLDLRIGVNDGGDSSTRSLFPESEDGSFEMPATDFEKVSTLRVVIVDFYTDKDGVARDSIEHNRMVGVRSDYSDVINGYYIINDNLQFKVSANGVGKNDRKKKIYLFANEKAVNDHKTEAEQFDFSTELAPGKPFPTEKVEGLLIVRPAGEPFINNNPDTQQPRYVPMSEQFDITVPEVTGAAEDSYTHTLFLTRSLIKFSFAVKTNDYVPIPDEKNRAGGFPVKITGVTIDGLADKCYYLPKDTEYNPNKYSEAEGGRVIESFSTPVGNIFSDCDFNFIEEVELTAATDRECNTYLYLPESSIEETESYMLTLHFDNPVVEKMFESKPLQIKKIARNTHMKINITISGYTFDAQVTVLPYTGVYLNPTFGVN